MKGIYTNAYAVVGNGFHDKKIPKHAPTQNADLLIGIGRGNIMRKEYRNIKWTLRNIIFITLMMLPLLSTSCSSELLPKALAAATQDTVLQVKEENGDVFAEIQRNIDLVTDLKAKVQDAQLNNKPVSLNNIIKDLETVTQSYEKLAGQRDNIRQELLGRVKKVENMRKTVDAEIKSLQEREVDYTEQLRLVNDPDPDIAKTRKEALARAIKYVQSQISLWRQFSNVQRDIIIEMSGIQRTIDSFLAMIESTSIVFREGLNLLYLQRDINEAIALFASDIPTMEQLTQEMERSWDNLDYLLETLTGVASIGKTISQ
uniref:Uncharacterized protein n=1 Tax=viral metagenome TaxID=1070528 RepID=A0A6M3LI35_9ZZZZ